MPGNNAKLIEKVMT